MSDKTQAKKTSIGGQALIEGIMMRGPEKTAMAVRNPEGEIVLESWPTQGQNKPKICKIPFVRGIFNMIDSLRFGYKCLMRSAELAGLEEDDAAKSPARLTADPPADCALSCETVAEEEANPVRAEAADADAIPEDGDSRSCQENEAEPLDAEQTSDGDESGSGQEQPPATDAGAAQEQAAAKESSGEKFLMSLLMVFSVILGVLISVGLFIWLPSFQSGLLADAFPVMENWALKSVFEGVLRIALFVGYILLVSLMKDIRRVFMYHGAEHKAIFCYEKGEALTVENVRRQIEPNQ